mmetsp:Transcript_34727/g.63429  ORF Transcript_34727/g.63429 Transcript_34727/m.63429 type:complete len:404 (+) Transcript_34727:82-1293(+)
MRKHVLACTCLAFVIKQGISHQERRVLKSYDDYMLSAPSHRALLKVRRSEAQRRSDRNFGVSESLRALALLLPAVNPAAGFQFFESVPAMGFPVSNHRVQVLQPIKYRRDGRSFVAKTLRGFHAREHPGILMGQSDAATETELGNEDDEGLMSKLVEEDENTLDELVDNDTSPTALTDDFCLLPGEPQVRIERAPSNSRRIFTGIDIFAPIDKIWTTLTDYEHLQDVVPSLVKNTVEYRTDDGGARLSQVGGAKVLPGVTFKAKTVLDVRPYDEEHPMPPTMMLENLPLETSDEQEREYFRSVPLCRDVFPRPYAYSSLPHRDITMQNVPGEGDFLHYQGVWRMQQLPNCAPEGQSATRLTYAVEVQPKGFLPVRLIEGQIAKDLKANLVAIKEHVEGLPVSL